MYFSPLWRTHAGERRWRKELRPKQEVPPPLFWLYEAWNLCLPGDVVVHSVSRLLVVEPVADENAGGRLPQLPGAQHAVTVALAVAEAALVHLAAGVPERTSA